LTFETLAAYKMQFVLPICSHFSSIREIQSEVKWNLLTGASFNVVQPFTVAVSNVFLSKQFG